MVRNYEIEMFTKKTQRKFDGIKNHTIWISIREDIKE